MKFIIKVSIVCVLIAAIMTGVYVWRDPEPISYTTYVVQKGDTLWTIASNESNGYSKMDTRVIIDHICEKNGCTSLIYPGDVLSIPQYTEE